jgi:Fic family protein
MHATLMASDARHTPGALRSEQVWIGRSSASPVGAEFVAPVSERVPGLLDDCLTFARRDDLPVLVQTAVTHAQFETIHPFTDGNGRTGRSLTQAMLRSKGVTRSVTVPVSAGLSLAPSNVYPLLRRLVESGVLQQKAEYKMGTIWRADEVLEALDAFALRAGRRGEATVLG